MTLTPEMSSCLEEHEDKHDDNEEDDDERQWDIDDKKTDNRSYHVGEGKDDVGKSVIERLQDRVDIVGEQRHDFAMGMCIEVGNRKRLHLFSQFTSDLEKDFLCEIDHDFIVEYGTEDTRCIQTDDQNDIIAENHRILA